VAEIQSVQEYADYCAGNLNSLGFRDERDKTEMAKKAIEERLDNQPSAKDQVRQALKLLQSQRTLEFERYYDLIAAGQKPRWSTEQQNYFEHAVRIIRSANYFFLSFTSRGPDTPGADKSINRRYWQFIRRTIRLATNSDRKERNLLADAIDTALRDEAIEGFYYKRHENDNSVVERKLREGCESCLVFLQLVDHPMFHPPRESNYCQIEYELARNFISQTGGLDEKRILFIVAAKEPADLPDPDTVYAPYKEWVEHIRRNSAVYLPPVPDQSKDGVNKIKEKIAGIVAQVKAAKKDMLDRVPN
jgi:hypothetical protein